VRRRGLLRPDDLYGVRGQAGAVTTHPDRRSRSPKTSKTGAAEANATKISTGEADVRKIQEALNQQGFNVGDADGKLGRRTKEALIAFQKQHGFRTTGKVDRQTLQALTASAASPAGPSAPAASAPQGAEPATAGQGSGARRLRPYRSPSTRRPRPHRPSRRCRTTAPRGARPVGFAAGRRRAPARQAVGSAAADGADVCVR
jgi:peptidoglycan hydrolase-like protein with peptidoglycan-binding domain